MATPQNIINWINADIITNGNNEITAVVLNPILVAMVQQFADDMGDLSSLTTTDKSNLVAAINEIAANFQGINGINAGYGILIDNTDPDNPIISTKVFNASELLNDSAVFGTTIKDALETLNNSVTPIINYSSLNNQQSFNPNATNVTSGTADFTLNTANEVAFITINGQTIRDDEYSLSGNTLTVTPDNGFDDITDEIIVFQHSYSSTSQGVRGNYTIKDANYTLTKDDYIVECSTNSFEITLPTLSVSGIGSIFIIKNSGQGDITINTLLDGDTHKLLPKESVVITNNGITYNIVSYYKDARLNGVIDYSDVTTATTPIIVSSNGDYSYLTNDEQGSSTNKLFPPSGVTDIWDASLNEFNFSQLPLGSKVEIRLDIEVTTTGNNQYVYVELELGIGSSNYSLSWAHSLIKNTGVYRLTKSSFIYIGNDNTKNNPAKFRIKSDGITNVKVNGWVCAITLY